MIKSFVISNPEERKKAAYTIAHEVMRESTMQFLLNYQETKDMLTKKLFYSEEEVDKILDRISGYHKFCLELGQTLNAQHLSEDDFYETMTRKILEGEFSDVHKAIYDKC